MNAAEIGAICAAVIAVAGAVRSFMHANRARTAARSAATSLAKVQSAARHPSSQVAEAEQSATDTGAGS